MAVCAGVFLHRQWQRDYCLLTPSVIQALGVKDTMNIGLLAAIPFILGTAAMLWNGFHSDKTAERRIHCAMATVIAGFGLICTGLFIGNAVMALIALTIAAMGILAAFPVFWSIPGAFWQAPQQPGASP